MMRKRLLKLLLLAAILTLFCTASVFADTKGADLVINGQKIDGAGVIIDGRVMVPIETLARAMGGTYEWTPESNTATITLPDRSRPAGVDLSNGYYTIEINRISEGLTILTLSGKITNTSNYNLTKLTVHGRLLDVNGQELTRTSDTYINPNELAPKQTGEFEVVFLDYYKFSENELRYSIVVKGI